MNCKQETYKRLGDYIREVDVRNTDLRVSKLVGLTIAKAFIPSVANTIGTDLSKYKIIKENQFACSLMQVSRDGKMPIAIYKGEDAIMSPAYPVFEVYKDGLLPDYLQMWFSRPEFDREAVFYAVGGVRGSLDWNDFMDMKLPIPAPIEQQRIVDQYNAIQKRIENNKQTIAKLEEAAQAIYRKMFVDDIDPENLPEGWRMGVVKDFGIVVTGKTPSSKCPEDFGLDVPFITPGDFNGSKFLIESTRYLSKIGADKLLTKTVKNGDLMVTCIGSDMGKVAIATRECISNQQINSIRVIKTEYTEYLYYVLANMKRRLLELGSGSSTLPMLNKNDFENIAILIPNDDVLKKFSIDMSSISKHILNISKSTILLNKIIS